MSNTQYGLPLSSNSTQTILPVVINTNKVVGFFTIAKTTFANPMPKTYALAEGLVPISTVTLPIGVSDGTGYKAVPQYVAALYSQVVEYAKPWLGYTSFIDPIDTGEFSRWSLPSGGTTLYKGDGSLIGALRVRMDLNAVSPVIKPAPNPQPANLNWQASTSVDAFNMECGFFDFNWVAQFNQANTGYNPMRITTVSNPAGGQLKSTVVSASGQSDIGAGAIMFDTVRIIMLRPVPSGNYTFVFAVTNDNNQTVNVNLNLNIT